MMAEIAPSSNAIVELAKSGWRYAAHYRQHPQIKRSAIQYNISLGGFTDDQISIVSTYVLGLTKDKSLIWNILLPELVQQLIKRILMFTDEEVENYMDKAVGASEMFLKSDQPKKRKKLRKQKTPTKRPR